MDPVDPDSLLLVLCRVKRFRDSGSFFFHSYGSLEGLEPVVRPLRLTSAPFLILGYPSKRA